MSYDLMTVLNFAEKVIMPSLQTTLNKGWIQVRPTYWIWNDPYMNDTYLEVTYYKKGTSESWSWYCMPDYAYKGSYDRKGNSDIAAVRRALRAWKSFPGDRSLVYAECCGHSSKFCRSVDPSINYL